MEHFVAAVKVLGRLPPLVEPGAVRVGRLSSLEDELAEKLQRSRGGRRPDK